MKSEKGTALLFRWRRALLDSDLPSTTKLVLLTLCIYGDFDGQDIFPSTRTLAGDTGLSERSVCTHLEDAEEKGWIVRRMRGVERAGRAWRGYEYDLFIPDEALNEVQQPKREDEGGGAEGGSAAQHGRGTEPGARGTEPDDIGALKEVQSTSVVTSPVTSVQKRTSVEIASLDARPAAPGQDDQVDEWGQFVGALHSGLKSQKTNRPAEPSEVPL